MTINEAINLGTQMLKDEEIDTPKDKARAIMSLALNQSKEYIVIHNLDEITEEQREQYIQYIKRLIQGEPLQYIIGKQEFMKLNFLVNKNVLIPRDDTEILVEEVLNIAKSIKNPKILDLCTGSGAIAVSLSKYIDEVEVTAIDISEGAIEIAKTNAILNGVSEKINFIKSDMFEELNDSKFDIIVSNPPYIETETIKHLNRDVKNEPILALDGGEDGLDFYRQISKEAKNYLKSNSYLCLEIGYNQKRDVMKILENEGIYVNTYCKQDLYGNDRIIVTALG